MTKMKEAFENLWEERKREARVAQSRASQQVSCVINMDHYGSILIIDPGPRLCEREIGDPQSSCRDPS